jgi:hypothetical protein
LFTNYQACQQVKYPQLTLSVYHWIWEHSSLVMILQFVILSSIFEPNWESTRMVWIIKSQWIKHHDLFHSFIENNEYPGVTITIDWKKSLSQVLFQLSLLVSLLTIFVYFYGSPLLILEIFSSKTVWKNWWGKNLFLPSLLNFSFNQDINPLMTSQPMYPLLQSHKNAS